MTAFCNNKGSLRQGNISHQICQFYQNRQISNLLRKTLFCEANLMRYHVCQLYKLGHYSMLHHK